jgi:hypothetical protein
MSVENPIIKPERHGLWIAAAFTVALLGLVAAMAGVFRVYELTYLTQAEFVLLNQKIADLEAHRVVAPGGPAAPTAPAK